MQITLRTFAQLRDLSVDRLMVDLPEGSRMTDGWAALAERHPAVEPHRPYVLAARNGAYAAWDEVLADGDEVAFLPPVSGGGPCGLTDGVIDVAALERAVADPGHGALVTFIGRARDTADDGRTVLELEYEAYAEMAESVLAEIVAEAELRWEGSRVAVVHRMGRVPIGEAAVAIVTASAHRAEAYEANRQVIEAIKQRLPIWKSERFADGTEWKRPGA
ncbi:MAG TPA: molybdenum cofactor biosynthesis protein MoaE [Candidatus Limnocylindria bacterium]|nr:molybdenum cofactor biosynthesis protein MoaE [Candidatus Limnocylindria bacterium]